MGRKKKPWYAFLNKKFFYRNIGLYANHTLIGGVIVTAIAATLAFLAVESREKKEFFYMANEISNELIDCLDDHAMMLRAGIAYMTLSDTVTQTDWEIYIENAKIYQYMTDVQGMGFSLIIPDTTLQQHVDAIRSESFPNYSVFPSYPREVYTSIVFVEPFTGRNQRAFGYDMFTDPVRRKAMEHARDNDIACLSGRIRLELDTGGEELYGSLMFVPFYKPYASAATVEQRRKTIRGWLYSPYRLKTLMDEIYKNINKGEKFQILLYDELVGDSTIMYDSQGIGSEAFSGWHFRGINLPIYFHDNKWLLHYAQLRRFPYMAFFFLIAGCIISILLYLLMKGFSAIESRSQQIRMKNKQLKTLNATKDKFFSIIAHDLKSPFNAVLGFSDMLVAHVDNMEKKDITRMAHLINKSANLAVGLLTNLMEWSQSQTGRTRYTPEDLEVGPLVDEVVFLFVDVANKKDIEIVKDLPDQLTVFADREMLKTIMRNLISNAIKFTPRGGRVTISAEMQEKGLLMSVADTGVGISEQNLKKIFRIDENFTTAGTEKEEGTGLGLILCREFVEKHKGRIWVESITGPSAKTGSVFSFRIPYKPAR